MSIFSSVSGENVRKLSIFSSANSGFSAAAGTGGGGAGDSQYLKVEPQLPLTSVVEKKPSMVRHLSMQHSSGSRSGSETSGGITIPENNLLKVEQQQKQFNKRPQMKRHFSESGTGVPGTGSGTSLVPSAERSVVIPEDDLLKVESQQPFRSNSQGHLLHR